jgi:hypothetical protein
LNPTGSVGNHAGPWINFHDRIKPGTTDAFYNAIKGLKFNQIQRGENLIFIKEGVLLG